MNKEEILEASRKENRSRDLAELEIDRQAGNLAGRVGACVCCLISVMALRIADTFLYSPWILYFSILGTHSLVRTRRKKRGTDLALTVLYFALCVLGFVLFVLRLTGENA